MVKIYLDDLRLPPGPEWIVARTVEECQKVILDNWGNIELISFDHDLGIDQNGICRDAQEIWNWLQEWMLDNHQYVEIPAILHSSNTSGGPYLMDKIKCWNKHVRSISMK